jgi:hypothetical protein
MSMPARMPRSRPARRKTSSAFPFARAREVYARIRALPGVDGVGVDMHIGSQITDMQPFDNAFALLAELVNDLRPPAMTSGMSMSAAASAFPINFDHEAPPDPMAYADREAPACRPARHAARSRAGPADRRQCRHPRHPRRVREGGARGAKTFVIVDAAMNDLIRPTLYEAHHDIQPVVHSNLPRLKADIVGPVCETGDYLAQDRDIEGVKEGDLLAVMSAGAYGAVMASTYNSRPLMPEVLVDAGAGTSSGRALDRRAHRPRQRAGLALGLISLRLISTLGDLHGVQRRALAQVVRHAPEGEAVLDRRILADARDVGRILAGRLVRRDVATRLALVDDEHSPAPRAGSRAPRRP